LEANRGSWPVECPRVLGPRQLTGKDSNGKYSVVQRFVVHSTLELRGTGEEDQD